MVSIRGLAAFVKKRKPSTDFGMQATGSSLLRTLGRNSVVSIPPSCSL